MHRQCPSLDHSFRRRLKKCNESGKGQGEILLLENFWQIHYSPLCLVRCTPGQLPQKCVLLNAQRKTVVIIHCTLSDSLWQCGNLQEDADGMIAHLASLAKQKLIIR